MKYLSFDDTLLLPKFSEISSRKNVSLSQDFLGMKLTSPVISSNMDTITESRMAATMIKSGAMGCLHRFCTIEENVKMFHDTIDLVAQGGGSFNKPMVSVGVGENEYKRAMALFDAGATHFVIDVAHGAATHVVEMYDRLRTSFNNLSFNNHYIIVGNFATAESIKEFNKRVLNKRKPDAYKIGIGGGSLCTTRVVTGCGLPTLSSLQDCKSLGLVLIADGGIRGSGDIAKSLAAGASVVMLGGMLSGTDETPGDLLNYSGLPQHPMSIAPCFKKYRGSASFASYEVQGKNDSHRAPEGEETLVAYKGPVNKILTNIDAGLRSSFSYVGAKDLTSFRENSILVEITNNGAKESSAHGKND